MVEIEIVVGDIMNRPSDLLILKHADGFHGVDGLVADRVGFKGHIREGDHAVVGGNNIEPRRVLFVGVGPLYDFRYEKIRKFAADAMHAAAASSFGIEVISSPIHGPGYGLDEKESFLSLIGGFFDAIGQGRIPGDLRRIEIVELGEQRAARLQALLDEIRSDEGRGGRSKIHASAPLSTHRQLQSFGADSERKTKLFVAMPFSDAYSDVWDIAIQEACANAGILCERISEQSFVGDIVSEIKKRLRNSSGIIAVLDDANANVFLELGYAWAIEKPAILVASSADNLPFDVRGQRCLIYNKKINELRKKLTEELQALLSQGIIE